MIDNELWGLAFRFLACAMFMALGIWLWRRGQQMAGAILGLAFGAGLLWYGFFLLFFGFGGSR